MGMWLGEDADPLESPYCSIHNRKNMALQVRAPGLLHGYIGYGRNTGIRAHMGYYIKKLGLPSYVGGARGFQEGSLF